MKPRSIVINSRKFDGKINRSWKCDLVKRSANLWVLVGVFEFDVDHDKLGLIRKATASREYYWFDRWYSVFEFREPDGKLRNYYCNINMPPEFRDGTLDYVDLDIDIVVWPNGTVEILDLIDYEQNSELYRYPTHVAEQVEAGVAELKRMIAQREFPFDSLPAN